MSLNIEQILATTSKTIVPYEEKPLPVNLDAECKAITRLISESEKRLVALYSLFGFLHGNEIPYVASAPFIYWYFHNGWCISDNYSQLTLKNTKQQNYQIIAVKDSLSKSNRGFVWFDVGREERSRTVSEESNGWFFKKVQNVKEKYLSDVCLFNVRTSYEFKNEPACENLWDVGEYSVPELAEVLTNCLYLPRSSVRKSQAKFFLELFEKLPACLAGAVRDVLK